MKLLLSISLIFSFVVSADDHETPEYKYEPDVNKAEYYIGNYIGTYSGNNMRQTLEITTKAKISMI